jgi:hypothetical protein
MKFMIRPPIMSRTWSGFSKVRAEELAPDLIRIDGRGRPAQNRACRDFDWTLDSFVGEGEISYAEAIYHELKPSVSG